MSISVNRLQELLDGGCTDYPLPLREVLELYKEHDDLRKSIGVKAASWLMDRAVTAERDRAAIVAALYPREPKAVPPILDILAEIEGLQQAAEQPDMGPLLLRLAEAAFQAGWYASVREGTYLIHPDTGKADIALPPVNYAEVPAIVERLRGAK
jgi:hypothetical protein